MQLTPWDIPAPNADDPAPRFVKPIPANDLHAIFGHGSERYDFDDDAVSEAETKELGSMLVKLLVCATLLVCVALIVSGVLCPASQHGRNPAPPARSSTRSWRTRPKATRGARRSWAPPTRSSAQAATAASSSV